MKCFLGNNNNSELSSLVLLPVFSDIESVIDLQVAFVVVVKKLQTKMKEIKNGINKIKISITQMRIKKFPH